MRLLAVVLLVIALTGCGYTKPQITGFHWQGNDLFAEDGEEAASVVIFPFNVQVAQACIFSAAQIGKEGCTYWDNGQDAFNYIGRRMHPNAVRERSERRWQRNVKGILVIRKRLKTSHYSSLEHRTS